MIGSTHVLQSCHLVWDSLVKSDFKKAFDSVPHEQLLFKFKLSQVGITGPLWNWFRCRLHFVTIDGY